MIMSRLLSVLLLSALQVCSGDFGLPSILLAKPVELPIEKMVREIFDHHELPTIVKVRFTETNSLPLLAVLADQKNELLIEKSIFSGCDPPCRNGGVCRGVGLEHERKCICPMNFTGAACETRALPKLASCIESTCNNGGQCVGNSSIPACSCLPGMLGVDCSRRIRTYNVILALSHDGKPIAWNHSFEHPTSELYKKFSTAVVNMFSLAAKLGGDSHLVETHLSTKFNSFLNQSGQISITLSFDFNDSLAAVHNEEVIRRHLLAGGTSLMKYLENSPFASSEQLGQISTTLIKVNAEDMCTTANHDCSRHAVCQTDGPGLYTCTCRSFTIDVSVNNDFPGRRCVYDGLIILTFFIVGCILCTLVFILFGCRRTIWYRYRKNRDIDQVTLVNMSTASYDI